MQTRLLTCRLAGAGMMLIGCQAQPAGATTRPTALMAQLPRPADFDAPPPAERPAAAGTAVQDPPLGKPCGVHFRRDALGLSSPAPLALSSESIAGRAVVLHGTLRQINPDWLVVESAGKSYWIPRSAILLLEFGDQP